MLKVSATSGLEVKEVEVNVKKGDLVGLYAPTQHLIPYNGSECWTQRAYYKDMYRVSNPEPGDQIQFSVLPSGSKPCRNYSLSLAIKPGQPINNVYQTSGFGRHSIQA